MNNPPTNASYDPLADRRELETVLSAGIELRPGDRVTLWPQAHGDIMDIVLRGRQATIAAIEQDYENRIHLAVTVDDDPGRDFGEQGKPGHRFFFSLDEVQVVGREQSEKGTAND